jgi:hypothetical protein
MPARELADRKRNLVTELNNYIALKKSYTTTEQGRGELMEGAASPEPQCVNEGKALGRRCGMQCSLTALTWLHAD